MKVIVTEYRPEFSPVKLEILLETEEELDALGQGFAAAGCDLPTTPEFRRRCRTIAATLEHFAGDGGEHSAC